MDHLGVIRMLFATSFLALGFYLAPALLKLNADGENQRPKERFTNGLIPFCCPRPLQLKEFLTSRRRLTKFGSRIAVPSRNPLSSLMSRESLYELPV